MGLCSVYWFSAIEELKGILKEEKNKNNLLHFMIFQATQS